jgi:hypothetical protein
VFIIKIGLIKPDRFLKPVRFGIGDKNKNPHHKNWIV